MRTGHDAIFIRSSAAPVTSLLVRDTKLQHNPAGALYTSESYFRTPLYRNHYDALHPLRGHGGRYSSRDTDWGWTAVSVFLQLVLALLAGIGLYQCATWLQVGV